MNESYREPSPDRARNREESFKYLNGLLTKIHDDIAGELKESYGLNKRLINKDCSIRMDAFDDLDHEQVRADWAFVKGREKIWSGIEKPERRLEIIRQFGLDPELEDTQIIQKLLQEKAKEKSKQLEMVITILLHKAFGDKYIVVRSSKYDDYANGVDNLIVNKETGAVICAVDDVRGNEHSERASEKDKNILAKTQSGGARLAYGFTFNEGRIELRSMRDLPIFCLELSEEEYEEIVNAIEYGDDPNLNSTEQAILAKILASIGEQKEQLLADAGVQKQARIVENLRRVDELLDFQK